MLIFRQLTLIAVLAVVAAAQTSFSGTLDNGSKVRLYVDGTWEYVDGTAPNEGRAYVESNVAGYALSYDPAKWTVTATVENGPVTLTHVSGNAHAILIAEQVPFVLESLPEVFLKSAQRQAPDATNLSVSPAIVSGVDVLRVEMTATSKSIPIRYRAYYFGGQKGNSRLTTYAAESDFDAVAADLDELLDGYKIDDVAYHARDNEKPRSIELLGGGTFTFDPAAWTMTAAEPGRHEFRTADGASVGFMIEERDPISMEELLEAAVTNAGNGNIVANEEVTVGEGVGQLMTMTNKRGRLRSRDALALLRRQLGHLPSRVHRGARAF